MLRCKALAVASLLSASLAACSSLQKPMIEPPDAMAQLANANLSSVHPIQNYDPSEAHPAKAIAEKYPGDDRIITHKDRFHGVKKSAEGYELNFSNAEISDLAKIILKDTLGITYVFDPHIEGRVTLSTGGPVSRSELLSILESVLATYNGALVVQGNLYRIVKDADAREKGIVSFDYAKESKEVGPGYGVSVFALKYVSNDVMMRMLGGLMAKQDDIRTSVYNNLLFIRGTSQARQSVADIISMFDVDWMKGQSAGIFMLKDSAPKDVIRELEQVFHTSGQGHGLVRFQAIARLNAILVLAQKSETVDKAQDWISRLDRSGADDDNYYVYRVENGRARNLARLLMSAFTGGGGSVRGAEENEVAPTLAASRIDISNDSGSGITGSNGSGSQIKTAAGDGPLKSAAPRPAEDTFSHEQTSSSSSSSASSGQIRITPDEHNNTLLIKASARDYRKILQVLRRIDRQPLQVLINATLAEVTLNDNLAYGVQFYLQKHGGEDGLLGFSTGQALAISSVNPGLNFILGNIGTNPRVILDALAKETTVRVVSSPSVVVLHNQPATLEVGDQVPIITRQAQSVINPDSPVVNEIEFKNTGVILNVTPRINTNGLVTMEIQQEVSAVEDKGPTTDTLTPTISQRRITSTIAVQSGQMVVLGGLIREQVDHQKSRMPVLGKIPYVGDILGGNTHRAKTRTELIVFIRPTVIRNSDDASNVAEALRAGMRSLAPRPAAWDANIKHPTSEEVSLK